MARFIMLIKQNPVSSMLLALLRGLSYIFIAIVGYSNYFSIMYLVGESSEININFGFFDFLLLVISLLIILREMRLLGNHVTSFTKQVSKKTRYFTSCFSLILTLALLYVTLSQLVTYEVSWCLSVAGILTLGSFSLYSLFPKN